MQALTSEAQGPCSAERIFVNRRSFMGVVIGLAVAPKTVMADVKPTLLPSPFATGDQVRVWSHPMFVMELRLSSLYGKIG